ncbi:putative DNA helicase, partial [Pseudomonas syringae pv. pisi str. 1704B]
LSALQQALSRYEDAARLFAELSAAGTDTQPSVGALRATSLSIQQHEEQLKAWCDWCRVREQAGEAGFS